MTAARPVAGRASEGEAEAPTGDDTPPRLTVTCAVCAPSVWTRTASDPVFASRLLAWHSWAKHTKAGREATKTIEGPHANRYRRR